MMNYVTTIGEIAEIFDGPHATPTKIDSGPFFLSISSLEKGRLDLTKSAFLSEDDFKRWTKRVTPQQGDILFSYETRLGEAAIMPRGIRACLGRRMGLLRPKQGKVIPEYLLYAYLSPAFQQTIISNTIRGATVDRIALNELPNFEIRIPPISEQKKLVRPLLAIDQKIEINNKINVELEEMIKTIYDYWFVQFDFPDENGKPYKSSGGKMAWNEAIKRDIPADWTDGVLSSIAKITMGQSPPGESYNEKGNGLPFFQGCTDFGVRFPDVRQYTYMPSRIANPGDILLSVRAPVGSLNIANEKCCIGRGLAALKSNNGYTSYLWGILRHLARVFERRNVDGTTFGAITKDDLFSLAVIKPSEQVLKRFQSATKPAYEMQNKIEFENRELIALRDWLLPMLMNGQVKVV
ncbi:MAG TPA: restriction endonuclease subunit S [Candidatus Rifleibacterium sp.]|nr:restriction endonuclease subunit S [Candidatus Rifleibacterium sp.]